jgi:cytidine deaminase
METIIDKLCKKRLCLPINTDINFIRNGQTKISSREHYSHIACILDSTDSCLNELSYGINMYNCSKSTNSIHAEVNAIMKLPPLPRKKNLKKIDILVIRTSSTGKLGISKPCGKCLIDMYILPPKRGYIVKNIFYTDTDGNIINTTLKRLINSNNYHISQYHRHRNFQLNICNLCIMD